MRITLLLLFALIKFSVHAQQISPISLVSASKQSSFSIRPEVALFSQKHAFEIEKGAFSIHPKPGVSIGYSKRYQFYKSLGFELGIFGGVTRFSYTAIAPKEKFPSRSHTYEHSNTLINPFLSVPILLNFQRALNNKYLLTLFGGANLEAHFLERISSGLGFANAPGDFPTGDVVDVELVFRNKPINTGIILGAGIGRMLPNHNILQLNLWATLGLSNQMEGGYVFYKQEYDNAGEKVLNVPASAGLIESKGSSLGVEMRYTLTGIRKRLQ